MWEVVIGHLWTLVLSVHGTKTDARVSGPTKLKAS